MAHDPGGIAPPNPHAVPASSGFPERYIVFGVFVGLFLTLLGGGILIADGFYPIKTAIVAGSLTICVGFGIILAAFGARASGRWAGWSAAGAGAMSVLLFVLLQKFAPVPINDFMKGALEGDFSRVAELRIIDETPMYMYRDRATSTINFLSLAKELKSRRVRLQVDTTEGEGGREYFQLVGDAKTIKQVLARNGGVIQWSFDYNNRRVMDGGDVILSEQGTILNSETSDNVAPEGTPWWSLSAYAGQLDAADVKPDEVDQMVTDLRSDDIYVRRNARDALTSAGLPAIRPVLEAWRGSTEDYRLKIGATYVLTEVLRSQPESREQMSALIPDDALALLVTAASDEDKTIRFQAAEFLYTLGDPRSVDLSVAAVKQAPDENTATNQILILRQAGATLPGEEKKNILDNLEASGALKDSKAISDPGALLRDVLQW